MTEPDTERKGSSRRGFLAGLGAAALTGAGIGMAAGEVLRPLLPDSDPAASPEAEQRLRMAAQRADATAAPQPGISGPHPRSFTSSRSTWRKKPVRTPTPPATAQPPRSGPGPN